jgi:hypothetical protein
MLLFVILTYTLPIDSPQMGDIEYLQLRGLIDIPSIRPYDAEWIINQIDEILVSEIELNTVDRKIISHFTPLLNKNPNFSYLFHIIGEYQNEPQIYQGALDERLGGNLFKDLRFAQAMRIRRANKLDSLGPAPWHEFQAYLTEGLVTFKHEKTRFELGRRNFLIGPGDTHGLLLSQDRQGYDGFFLHVPSQYYEFYGMFSMLDAAPPRYLSLHHFGLDLRRFLKIGFTEAILWSGSLEPLYLNIFLPFYLSQWGLDRDDNIMWSFDLQLHILNSIFYSELLIDDYMYEDDPYPDKLAYQVGLKSLLWKSLVAKLNYTRVDKWVYTHHEEQNTYERSGRCLGFPSGNDVDQLTFTLKYVEWHGMSPHISVGYVRKGEGSIYVPYEIEGGPINPPFPSGEVERTFEMKIGTDYNLIRNFYLMVDIGKTYRYNTNHIADNDSDHFVFNLGIWAIL